MKIVWALALVACARPSPSGVIVPTPSAAALPAVSGTLSKCTPTVGQPWAISIPPRLQAIAPQYFHPSVRDDGFNDLVPGTNHYQWYDPLDLNAPVDPPRGMDSIHRSTTSFFFGWGDGGHAYVARRADTTATIVDTGLSDLDMVEDARGHAWVLLGRNDPDVMTRVVLLEVEPSLHWQLHVVSTFPSAATWDRRIGITAHGDVAVVWVEPAAGALLLETSWLGPDGFQPSHVVDRVDVPAEAVALSVRSTMDLRTASDGHDRIAIAWRPIVPKDGEVLDVGSATEPPEHAASAQVRIVTTDAHDVVSRPTVFATHAMPLGGVSGEGPWPLQGSGMISATLAGHALFFWAEANHVAFATPGDTSPRVALQGAGYRLLPRTRSASSLELLALQSAGPQQVVPFTCE